MFFKALGEKKSARIELAAMDMWKAFRNSVMKNAPNARIIYDKFHISHLSKALDEVRRSEYKLPLLAQCANRERSALACSYHANLIQDFRLWSCQPE